EACAEAVTRHRHVPAAEFHDRIEIFESAEFHFHIGVNLAELLAEQLPQFFSGSAWFAASGYAIEGECNALVVFANASLNRGELRVRRHAACNALEEWTPEEAAVDDLVEHLRRVDDAVEF